MPDKLNRLEWAGIIAFHLLLVACCFSPLAVLILQWICGAVGVCFGLAFIAVALKVVLCLIDWAANLPAA
jgi:hypothetical protein